MQDLILTLHIIVCFLLVILILLQSGKEGMGVIFGGGNSSVFGSAGAGGILAKLTTLMAIIFVITSLSYTYVTSSRPTSESAILNVQIEDMPQQDAKKSDQPDAVQPDAAATPQEAKPATEPSPIKEPGSTAEPPAAQDSNAAASETPPAQESENKTE